MFENPENYHTQILGTVLILIILLMIFICVCISGYFLSDQHILSPINPKYDRLILSDLQRFTKIVLKCKIFETTRTIYSNSESSEQFLVT